MARLAFITTLGLLAGCFDPVEFPKDIDAISAEDSGVGDAGDPLSGGSNGEDERTSNGCLRSELGLECSEGEGACKRSGRTVCKDGEVACSLRSTPRLPEECNEDPEPEPDPEPDDAGEAEPEPQEDPCFPASKLATDPDNCGRCERACHSGIWCFDGSCVRPGNLCPWGGVPCGDECIGEEEACDEPCAVESCEITVEPEPAAMTCPAGEKECGEACITDDSCCNDDDCTGPELCNAGSCEAIPVDPCANVDLQADDENCGECGNECGAGEHCRAGSCRCEADTQNNPQHCGVCGEACPAGQTCERGECTDPKPRCGNGAVDSGEECDPGKVGWSERTCDPETCQRQIYEACDDDSDCHWEGSRCVLAYRLCLPPCMDSDPSTCLRIPGVATGRLQCFVNACLITCESQSDCPEGLLCEKTGQLGSCVGLGLDG